MIDITDPRTPDADPAGPGGTRAASLDMDPNHPAGATPTAYHWQVPGKGVTVSFDFDVVDRLGQDIMRGFSSVPRRGAEVGGVLLGTAEQGDQTVIRVEDFAAVVCEHASGPSYILSENDSHAFAETVQRWAPAPDRRVYAVGFYRSNTRDQLQLTPVDTALLDQHFPAPNALCLMVRPYATRVSEGTCFVREGGRWPEQAASDVFPFRRREMGGGKPSRPGAGQSPLPEPPSHASDAEPAPAAPAAPRFSLVDEPVPAAQPEATSEPPKRSKVRSGWVWLPLSFIFLLLGVMLGFQIAISYRSATPPAPAVPAPYQMMLSAEQSGANLHLQWNPEAAAVRTAGRGILHIEDGDNEKTFELTSNDLARGGVLYRNSNQEVAFRLEVFHGERNSVSESLTARSAEPPKPLSGDDAKADAQPTGGAEPLPKADTKRRARRR